MRILVVGAGVIGSVYAGRLLEAGHSVTLCARGRRFNELHEGGLILEDAQTGERIGARLDQHGRSAADQRQETGCTTGTLARAQ
jgi:ketopantoate reductase